MIVELPAAEFAHADDGEPGLVAAGLADRQAEAGEQLLAGDGDRLLQADLGQAGELQRSLPLGGVAVDVAHGDAQELLVAKAPQHVELLLIVRGGFQQLGEVLRPWLPGP